MSDEFPALEGEVSMQVPAGEGEAVPEEAAAPEPAAAAPVVEMRKKKPCALYWKRPKSHLYEYNYGYGENYYKGMIDYLDERSNGFKPSPPKPLNWAERALKSYTEKREAAARSNAINPDVELLHKIRNNVNTYTVHAKAYARKYTTLSSLMLWMHQWQNKQDPTTDRSDASQNQASSIIVLNWNPAKMSRYQKYDNKKNPKKKSKTKQNKRG